jgi:hypothetical protein
MEAQFIKSGRPLMRKSILPRPALAEEVELSAERMDAYYF